MQGQCIINGTKKHIKCVYAGINGKAQYVMRPFGVDVIKYGGEIAPLSDINHVAISVSAPYAHISTSALALIAGGSTGNISTGVLDTVEAYDNNLIKFAAPNLDTAVYSGFGGSLWDTSSYGPNSIVAGGGVGTNSSGDASSTVTCYDSTSLVKSSLAALSDARFYGASVDIWNNAVIFAGGYNGDDAFSTVDIYTKQLTKISGSDLSIATIHNAGASNRTYAIITGGQSSMSSTDRTYYDIAEAYDSEYTKQQISSLTYPTSYHCGTTAGVYALFMGGTYTVNGSRRSYSNSCDIYDRNLTKTHVTTPFSASQPVAVTLRRSAIDDIVSVISGIYAGTISNAYTAFSCDTDLTFTQLTNLSAPRYDICAVSTVRYAVFAGGNGNGGCKDVVDAYCFNDGYVS